MERKKETKMQEIRRRAREQTAEDVAAEYRKYREEKGQDCTPCPGCVPCPDCGGDGVVVKEIPILRVKAGKICKTCGGRGYLPEGRGQ